jgi:polar amino acid transport system permease protein
MTAETLETPPGVSPFNAPGRAETLRQWRQPHRIVLALIAAALVVLMMTTMRWDWLPKYSDRLLLGAWRTVWLLVLSVVIGFLFAVPLGFVQVTGPKLLAWPARGFCTLIRGTPLLLQLWLLYFGLGSLFPHMPAIRQSFLWDYLRLSWPYGLLALTLSFAGYEGEVMRGAFAGVPRGELEAARAFGMGRFTTLRRIWLPRAFYRALPTLGGEVIMQLKSTPLVATITVVDVYGVIAQVRQDTYLVYSPLIFLAFVYMCLTGVLVVLVRLLESRMPVRGT